MDREIYAQSEAAKSNMLTPALVGTGMAFVIFGKLFQSYGYEFLTIVPSVILLICLWWPVIQRLISIKSEK